MLCFVVVMQSFIMNSHEVFIHIHQTCFAGTGAIVRLPQCQWSKPDGYGKISQCITTTKHIKAKTVCIFLGIYCICRWQTLQTNRRRWTQFMLASSNCILYDASRSLNNWNLFAQSDKKLIHAVNSKAALKFFYYNNVTTKICSL